MWQFTLLIVTPKRFTMIYFSSGMFLNSIFNFNCSIFIDNKRAYRILISIFCYDLIKDSKIAYWSRWCWRTQVLIKPQPSSATINHPEHRHDSFHQSKSGNDYDVESYKMDMFKVSLSNCIPIKQVLTNSNCKFYWQRRFMLKSCKICKIINHASNENNHWW